MRQLWLFLMCFILTGIAKADGLDIISWETIGNIPPTVLVSQAYRVIYVFTNKAPFAMPTPLFIAKNTPNTAEFNFIDRCSGLALLPQQQCIVIVSLKAITTGPKSAELALGYGNNSVPLPEIETQALPG